MWPFTSKTLYDRYSKLMKLIMSIDSHFLVTENTESSVRLHLPNYKGNQPMDFHIYLLEPFLFISFVTEIEGKKISVLNNYHQSINQQDMFNMAMASNLNRVQQVLKDKYQDKIEQENKISSVYSQNKSIEKTDNKKQSENKNSRISYSRKDKLSDSQRYSLYYFAAMMGGCLYYNAYIDETPSKEILDILLDYKEELELTNEETNFITSERFNLRLKQLFSYIREVKDEFEINSFLMTCALLVDLNYHETSGKDFFKLAQELGFNEEETKERLRRNGFRNQKFFFDNYTETTEDELSTEVTDEDWVNAWTDEYGVMYSKDGKRLLRAPYSLEEYSIKEGTIVICNNSFDKLHKLKTVDIPSSITIIGEFAFYNCRSLCSITIPSSVHVIKKGAFCECRALNNLELNEGVTIIESYAFSGYKKMASLRIPESVIEIGDEAFWNCCYIERIFLPRNVGKLGIGVFSNCSRLQSIIVDKDNEVYDSRDNCNAIIETKSNTLVTGCSSTIIPQNVLCIGILAFGGCTKQHLSIPNNVITISDRAFADCYYLTSINLSLNLRHIGNRAFSNCENLISIFIPESVVNIGTATFENCYRLGLKIIMGFISVHPDNKIYNSMNNCNAIVERSSNTLIVGCAETIIPDGVTTIGDYAFSGCKELITLLIPKSVNSIGKMAFAFCTNLVSVVFSDSISNIDKDSFYRCEKLENILVPVGKRLKYALFIPNDAEKIKERNLEDILNTSVSKKEIEEAWTDENGAKYSQNRLRLLEAPRGVERFFVRFGTLAICDNSFDSVGKDTLIDFILPNTVLTIGKFAFANNKGLYSLYLPSNLTFIGESAFAGCTSLERVFMPLTIPIIGKNLFERCGNLKFIFIPYGSIQKYAQLLEGYEKCLIDVCDIHSSLTDTLCGIKDERGVVYSYDGKRLLCDGGRNTQYEIKNGTLAISDRSFESRFDYACLERIIIPNTVFYIGANAFYNCCFDSIEIPNSVIYIGFGAFENCYCLKEIRLPKSLKAIDGEAFADCSSLTDVYIPTKVNIADNITGIGVFYGCNNLNNIYIPKGTRTYYEKLLPEHKEKLVELPIDEYEVDGLDVF